MNVERQIERASDLERSGDWAEAIAIFDEIVEKYPNDPNATYAKNCAAELRERQEMAGDSEEMNARLRNQQICVAGRDILIPPEAEAPTFCFSCATTTDLGPGSVRVMAKGIPLVTFDKDVGTFYVPVCSQCRKRKWQTRIIGIICLISVVLFPIGAFILLRRWHFTTAWYNGNVIRIPNAPAPFRKALSTNST